ncbi:flagellar filament capping protein FliD [Thermanaeromonas sp. C210]|uniref:flagellar filament capping protein FliD n=1 Tax=Thermanaeromonas sp. C210 TaxID=2731925 RepID=UPI00155D33AE|nr:flagellar filament capping protein FliD [Thermanaeromonas sp. C210]GFN24160.1 flagellar hook protein FliD [Thermanaeromonas sp. C210]
MAGTVNRVGGLASGLDIDQIISDLMKAQRLRLDRIKQDKEIWQWRQEDYRSLNSSLLALRNVVFNLRLQATFTAKTAASSDSSIVTAAAAGSAVPTVYQVKVESLATAATNVSTESISKPEGDKIDPSASLLSQLDKLKGGNALGLNENNTSFSFTINGQEFTVDAATDSLNTIIAKVNATKEAGVTMFYDPVADKVAIATTYTGDRNPAGDPDGDAEIQLDGAFLTEVLFLNEANEQGGTDAKFSINGLELTSHTNSYTVNGVTFNFTGITAGGLNGTATTVTVDYDVDAAVKAIKDFVDKYNEVIALINAKLNEARYPDYRPLTETEIEEGKLTEKQIDQWQAKARSGILKNDPLLRSVLDSMRRVLGGVVEGLNEEVTVTVGGQKQDVAADRLSVIGITTGPYTENGKLYLDEGRLREALESNPEAVMALFTRTRDENGNELPAARQGIAQQLYEAINKGIERITSQAGTAGALVDNSYIGRLLREYDRRLEDYEERLARLEDRYWRQFTALETAINRMNMQSMWLAQNFMSGGQ